METLFEITKRKSELYEQVQTEAQSNALKDHLENFFGPEILEMVEIKGSDARIKGSSCLYISYTTWGPSIYLASDNFDFSDRYIIPFHPENNKNYYYSQLQIGFDRFKRMEEDRSLNKISWWKKLFSRFNRGGIVR